VEGYGKRVLVVEDDHDVRMIICLMLGEAGYNVYEAADGLEALEAMKKRRYDAVLTDYHMPRMDGLELLDLVQAMWPSTPVIVLSSDRRLTDQAGNGLLAPAYAVLAKPFESTNLLSAVRCATSGVPRAPMFIPKSGSAYQAVA
jgi:CheY-like chemotaxis protein